MSFESFASSESESSAVEGLTVCVPFALAYEMMVARGVSEPAYISLPPGLSLIGHQQDSSFALIQDLQGAYCAPSKAVNTVLERFRIGKM